MGKIIYIPLENLEERYTEMFNESIRPYCDEYLYPNFGKYQSGIENGEFLDIDKTMIFKAKQLEMIAEMFYSGQVSEGDSFIVADIFFPGIESIRYMSELRDIKVHIYAFNHAGRSDKDDFVQKLGPWSDHSERGYHEACDAIFFGSQFHADRTASYFKIPRHKCLVSGMIWNKSYVDSIYNSDNNDLKEDVIVFPHRLSKEKGVSDLKDFAEANRDKRIIVTSSNKRRNPIIDTLPENVEYRYGLKKKEYYRILSCSKYYLSTAYQETFGYTLQEAIHYGCLVAVPDRNCYPEMVPLECLYDDINAIDYHSFNKVGSYFAEQFDNNAANIIRFIQS